MKILMIGPDLSVKGGMTSLNKMILNEEQEVVSIQFVPSMDKKTIFGRFTKWFRLFSYSPLRRFTNRPDIVHIHVSSGLSIWRKTSIGNLWALLGVPVIYHTHGSKARDFIEGSPRIVKYLISKRFRRAAGIVTLSNGWKKWYSESLNLDTEKITILPTPIYIKNNFEENKNRSSDVLYSGLMGDRKGTFELIEAWSMLSSEERGDSKLHLIGDGEVSRANELVKKLNLRESCEVYGWVDEKKKEELLMKSGIYALPSHNEGLPMGLLEAMSYGLAPISTTVGAIPEVINNGENGYVIDPGNISEISEILRVLIAQNSHRKEMGLKARESAKEHGWDRYFPKLIDLWRITAETIRHN